MLSVFCSVEGFLCLLSERYALGGSTLARAALRRLEASSGLFFVGNLGLMIERSALGGYACSGWPGSIGLKPPRMPA